MAMMSCIKPFLFLIFVLFLSAVSSTPVPNEQTESSTDISPTEMIDKMTEKSIEQTDTSTEQMESRENSEEEFLIDQNSAENSTDSRYNIRDFYRRRRKKADESQTFVDSRLRVAKNQTAADILMQKIKIAKEQQKSYFDPAAPGKNYIGRGPALWKFLSI
jgi:hypothetical protein